jgi:lipid A ethanolaminephosphotransferase
MKILQGLWTHKPLPRMWVLIALALWLVTFGNWPLWREVASLGHLGDLTEILYAAGLGVIVMGLTTMLLGLLCWPGTHMVVVAFFLLASAFASYFMATYHVVIDSTMMTNVLQTDLRESRDLMSWQLLGAVMGVAVLPFAWYWRVRPSPVKWTVMVKQNLALVVGGFAITILALVLTFQSFASLMRNHTHVRYLVNPLNSLWSLGVVASEPFQQRNQTLQPLGRDAALAAPRTENAKPPLLVLVVGETARSTNFAVNGYGRPTTPHLSRLAGLGEIASFTNAWSCGTSTATSLPCMFSHLGKDKFEALDSPSENLLDVLHHAGLAVIWVDNQSGCKGLCERVVQHDTAALKEPAVCAGGQCLDEIMLRDLDAQIAALPQERRAKGLVVVLHQMGSHGPAYFKRSPPAQKAFQPECTTNVLKDCTREGLVNAYDNSIVYTDHFLNQVMQWQKARGNKNAMAMVYLSDHGESLGENNLYLHGLPYAIAPDHQKRIPWVTWVSKDFQDRRGVSQTCVNQIGNQRVSHDNLFHSVLGLLNVSTKVYQAPLDLYAPCAKP